MWQLQEKKEGKKKKGKLKKETKRKEKKKMRGKENQDPQAKLKTLVKQMGSMCAGYNYLLVVSPTSQLGVGISGGKYEGLSSHPVLVKLLQEQVNIRSMEIPDKTEPFPGKGVDKRTL